ncbi:MAG: hypothetical protein WCO10_03780 [bacterium]
MNKPAPTLQEIYPEATEDELVRIDFVMREHVSIVTEMFDRICADPEAYARFEIALEQRREEKKRHQAA